MFKIHWLCSSGSNNFLSKGFAFLPHNLTWRTRGVCGAFLPPAFSIFVRAPSSKKIRTPPAALAKSSKVSLALLTFVRKYVLCTLLRFVPHFIDHTYTFYVACALRQVRAEQPGAHELVSSIYPPSRNTHNGIFDAISLVFANLRGHHSRTALLQNLGDWLLNLKLRHSAWCRILLMKDEQLCALGSYYDLLQHTTTF